MLKTYLNQPVEIERVAKNKDGSIKMDNRGEFKYAAPASALCRKQVKTREILTADAQIIKTSHVYYLAEPVSVGDKLDGKLVQDVTEWVNLSGQPLGYKAAV